jgi:L-alanine-DL-glutamate epimerase-like enolase superfamily enzyme
MIKITSCNGNFDREPLLAPFGFKGQYIEELWQTIALMESDKGHIGLGLGVQSILWSDPQVLSKFGSVGGDNIMCLLTNYALKIIEGRDFHTPVDLIREILSEVYGYAKQVTGLKGLKETFALNALVPVDMAAWMLYSREKGLRSFDDMIPEEFRSSLSSKQEKLAGIPLITYGIGISDVVKLAEEGYPIFKIKIGSDPDMDKDPNKMLEWDKKRLKEIHDALKEMHTPYTANGRIAYYLDANGRYDTKDRIMDFLEFADRIGALENIVLLEEPFEEDNLVPVNDLPVRVAADESAHSEKDVKERIQLGYKAIALKPIAKTMSMSLLMAKAAADAGIPCFCADLTVNPIMIDWNKNFAARLEQLSGMKIGVLETNGAQNYKNWRVMQSYHPCSGSSWTNMKNGLFHLNDDFYEKSGGIFDISQYYLSRVKRQS